MKKLMLFLVMFLIAGIASAQYNLDIGVRSGGTSGITLKKNYEYSAV